MAATTSARPADQVLSSIPARPPTPPKEAPSRLASAPIKPAVRSSLAQHQSLHTPPSIHSLISPATTESNTSSGRLRKKVEWSAHTDYKDAPQYQEGGRLAKSSPVAASKPIKGILKASSSPCQPTSTLNTRLGSLTDQISISDMLDSTIKQLSGADRDSKVDAYMALARALKTSNNLPDRVALQGKLSLLTQFIQRDITLKSDNGVLDRSLVNHALLLLTTFLHFNAIASAIPPDFAVFITDHAIRSFEDPSMPKEVVRYLMQVMAFQSFGPKVMSNDRVGRLLGAIHTLEAHLSGKSIVMSRIHLYKRLVKQCPHHMILHASWLQDIFTDMLSLTKDIRTEAISLGLEAAFQLRYDKQVLRRVSEILETETDEKSFIEYYIERLKEMLKERDRSASVPQIWTVVNLFLRCPLEKWEQYAPWLTVIQLAFNTADSPTKFEANYAWNRYVYQCLSEGRLAPKSLTILCQPLLSQLRKKLNPKHQEEMMRLRRTAIGGACNLFYYAFRPGNDRHSPDMIWDVAVQPIMSQLVSLGDKSDAQGDGVLHAARLLNGLLDGATPRVWREDRIKDTSLVRADELPPLDSKWTRRNSERVFKILDNILEPKALDLANQESIAYRLWHSVVGAVSTASAKDIKVSEDTLKFFASAFGLLYKIWSKGVSRGSADAASRLLKGVNHMVQIMINGLGVLPFTEKKLAMTTPNSFEPVATPSTRLDRPEKSRGVVRSPMLHLLNLFCTVPEGLDDDEELSAFILSTFEPFFAGKSEKARLEQTRELLRALPRNVITPFGIWILASQILELPFKRSSKGGDKGDKILGPEYREMMSFMERGLTCHPNLPLNHWQSLLNVVDAHVVQNFGQPGRVLVIIEPLAKILVDAIESDQPHKSEQGLLLATAKLLADANFPRDKQAMDAARRHLWGAAPAASQHEGFKPFDNLFKLVNLTLKRSYEGHHRTVGDDDSAISLLDALTAFVAASGQHGASVLTALDEGLHFWVTDDQACISADDHSKTQQAVNRLWSEVCRVLIATGKPQKGRLGPLESVLTAGCESKNHAVVAIAVDAWNRMVDRVDEPDCSDSLKSILSTLNSKLDVEMTDSERHSNQSGAQIPTWSNRPGSSSLLKAFVQTSTNLSGASSALTPSPAKVSVAKEAMRKQRQETTPRRTRSRASKSATPRLRHDNSQIEFTAVASSSPLPEESQHLTERQKEVRERQQTEIHPYSEESAPPAPEQSEHHESQTGGSIVMNRGSRAREKTTPDRGTSYEELISLTPTPRRGQVLQLDDPNDPPSSPPEPRPYPLLSEIQTRSRASSSMEGWEFSSPPNSPILGSQNPPSEPPVPELSEEQPTEGRLDQEGTWDSLPALKATPSPVVQQQPQSQSGRSTAARIEVALPAAADRSPPVGTRTRRKKRKASLAKSERKPHEEEKATKRSLRSQSQEVSAPNTTSQEDDPLLLNQAESRNNGQTAMGLDCGAEATAESSALLDHIEPSSPIMKHASQSPSPAKSFAGPTSEAKSKRKNEDSNQQEGRKKRRKSSRTRADTHERASSPSQVAGESSGRRKGMRRSKRASQGDELDQRQQQQKDERPAASSQPAKAHDEEGDTDEELLSQLMTDSQAASHSQSQSRQDRTPPARSISSSGPSTEQTQEQAGKDQHDGFDALPSQGGEDGSTVVEDAGSTVLGMLRDGKEMLRTAAISREQVDQLEMMIMDLKRELYQAEYRGRGQ